MRRPAAAQQHLGQHGRASLVLDRRQFLFRAGTICGSDRPRSTRRPASAYQAEAAAYAKDILAAVEKSLTLSPVIRVRDGTYHSFLPPAPYMRGPASRFMPAAFGAANLCMHTPGLYADAIRGGVHFVDRSRLLPAGRSPRARIPRRVGRSAAFGEFQDSPAFSRRPTIPQKDWFSRSGWYYQCGMERTANLHLRLDDPAALCASFCNHYAVDVIPGPWTFREHTAAHGLAWTSPSRRPPSWSDSASCW